jgi:hypothetical protein
MVGASDMAMMSGVTGERVRHRPQAVKAIGRWRPA